MAGSNHPVVVPGMSFFVAKFTSARLVPGLNYSLMVQSIKFLAPSSRLMPACYSQMIIFFLFDARFKSSRCDVKYQVFSIISQ